jgi:hypothetical protein
MQGQARASKTRDGVLTAIAGLVLLAFWAGVAVFFWYALEPYRLMVVELWELIPASARTEVGAGLAIAGGVLLVLFVIVGFVAKDTPAPTPARRSRAGGSTHVGVDIEAADVDVSGL